MLGDYTALVILSAFTDVFRMLLHFCELARPESSVDTEYLLVYFIVKSFLG